MNIALFGYGKMGKMIAQIATSRSHTIGAKIDVNTPNEDLSGIDVAIDFSTPSAAFSNIERCIHANIPIISGTTGWLSNYDKAVKLCHEKKGAFIYASNFSLGVNLFFELNAHLAKIMSGIDAYKISMEEIHHTQKLDEPSGTAISLANDIISRSSYEGWNLNTAMATEIPITSKRVGNTPGTHTIQYQSSVDTIEIRHTAHNREGFALGAVIAAEWIMGKQGVFTMKDVLNLG